MQALIKMSSVRVRGCGNVGRCCKWGRLLGSMGPAFGRCRGPEPHEQRFRCEEGRWLGCAGLQAVCVCVCQTLAPDPPRFFVTFRNSIEHIGAQDVGQ